MKRRFRGLESPLFLLVGETFIGLALKESYERSRLFEAARPRNVLVSQVPPMGARAR